MRSSKRRRNLARALSVGLVVIGALLVAGSAVARPDSSTHSSTVTINVFAPAYANWTDLAAGVQKGFFQKQGVNVVLTGFNSGAQAGIAFQAGQGDILATCELASVNLWKTGSVVGISPEAILLNQEAIVGGPMITKPSDLIGKTIATKTFSTADYLLRVYLIRHHILPTSVKIISLNPGDMPSALERGDIQAYSDLMPFPALSLKADPNLHVLAWSSNYISEHCLLDAQRTFAQAHRGAIVSFLRALQQSQRWVTTHQTAAADLAASYFHEDVPTALSTIKAMHYSLVLNKSFEDDIDEVASLFALGTVNWRQWFDTSALKRVNASNIRVHF